MTRKRQQPSAHPSTHYERYLPEPPRPMIVVRGELAPDGGVEVRKVERILDFPWNYPAANDSASLCLLNRQGLELARSSLQRELILPQMLPGKKAEWQVWLSSDFEATVDVLDGGVTLSIVRGDVELWRAELPPFSTADHLKP